MNRLSAACVFVAGTTLCATVAAGEDDIVATVAGQVITLDEVDAAGGSDLHELATELYTVRVQSLYALLGDRLISREAQRLGLDVETLRQREITDRLTPVTDADVAAFIEQSPTLTRNNSRDLKRAELYLAITGRQSRTTQYIGELMERYNVQIALAAPPSPPPEHINGEVPPLIGRDDAPVSIVVFSDYQCRYCKRYESALVQVQARYPDQVNIVTRYSPSREDGRQLAEAALCAGEQGRYRDYHDALFARNGVHPGHIMDVAYSLGLDRDALSNCIEASRFGARVDEDVAEGRRLRIEGTPTSFINGVRVRGATGVAELATMIETTLSATTTAGGS